MVLTSLNPFNPEGSANAASCYAERETFANAVGITGGVVTGALIGSFNGVLGAVAGIVSGGVTGYVMAKTELKESCDNYHQQLRK